MSYMRGERKDHTLAATALVHEAYLRMVDSDIAWESRAHFYRVAARVLQHILVDHARARARQKRRAGADKISLEDVVVVGPEVPAEIIELDAALKRLGEKDPRKAEVVQLTFFAGLTCEETAQALNVSVITIHRDLRLAKAFLHSQLAAAQ
jgi:RNA polymerase sigma factor (TIGR02999 family)